MKKLFLLVSILFTTTYLSYGQTGTGSNTVNSSNPEYSTALGTGNTSTGYYSFAGGSNSVATGSHSFGFGQYVQSTADFAFIFGKGKDDNTGTLDFINNTPNSFMIGFNTTTPSFFVESFHIKGGGFVGIHTTSPTSELDVNGIITTLGFRMPQLGVLDGYVLTYDAEEDKAVWAQPIGGTQGGDGYWTSNGEHIHFVSANGPLGNGNVGIGPASSNPLEKLHVFGNLRINGYMRGGESSGALKVKSNYGYTIIGAKDASASYFETDRPNFEFSKKIVVNGDVEMEIARIENDIQFLSGQSHSINFGDEPSQIHFGYGLATIKYGHIDPGESNINIYNELTASSVMFFDKLGKVGINNVTPDAELDVIGKIKSTDLQFTSDGTTLGNVLIDSDGDGNAEWASLGSVDGAWQSDGNGNVYRGTGIVGIGAPPVNGYALAVNGSLRTNELHAENINTDDLLQALRIKTYGLQFFSSTNVSGFVLQADADGDATWVEQWKKESNGVLSSQNAVVIGTTNTTVGNHKLVVAGSINAQEILVTETVPGSDFVFEEDYELMPLSELESYVKTKKHLPEVMSAEEFKENGYNIGEMDDVLLRKVEELTLYMIAQQKEIEELKKKLSSLEDKK